MPRITPFLWFDTNAEDAVALYTSIFPNSRTTHVTRYGEGAPRPKDSVMTISFELDGQPFIALNGGPVYRFNPAVSFVVNCENQAEIDTLWDRLGANGGLPVQCGWITDRFGMSWQIVPKNMAELIKHPKAMEAMMKMTKIVIADLENAAKEG